MDTQTLTPNIPAGSAWQCSLSPWPVWGQLVDWTADKQPDENKAHNCLPESLAMCLKYLTGVELPADYIKDIEYGEGFIGDTSFAKALEFTRKYCETRCFFWNQPTNESTLWRVWSALHRGYPTIGLFHYGGTASGYPHCMPYVYLSNDTVKVADPWTASILTWDYATHDLWSMDAGITLQRTRSV